MLDRLAHSQRPVVVSKREFIALYSRCRPSSASALEQKRLIPHIRNHEIMMPIYG